MSETRDPIQRPANRETALSCAYLRLVGSTQAQAAEATGVDPRTLGRWEKCSWWAEVKREAADRWLAGLIAKARRGLELAVPNDGRLALTVLERLIPELAPPRLRASVEVDEPRANLLGTPFWRFVLSLHLTTGMTIAEAETVARREPEQVREWARVHNLLPPGEGAEE